MNQETIKNIMLRAKERDTGNLEPNHIKTALVVQGGTLRSVASCGSAAALNQLGLTNAFDTVYGASSGAVNAAYFLTEQAALGVTVYTEDVNNRRFLNFLRLKKMMDLEFFFDEIVQDRKLHNFSALKKHPTELKIITADLETAETVWLSSKDDTINIYDALKAGCALPIVYGRGVRIGNHLYVDGFMKEPMPILTPIESDYTDILVLMTQHISVRRSNHVSLFSRLLVEPIVKKQLGGELFALYQSRWERYNRGLDIMQAGAYQGKNGRTVRIAYICPDVDFQAGKYETDGELLARAAYSAWRNCLKAFGTIDGIERVDFDAMLSKAKQANKSLLS
ncbi:MAG: patatin-like phospholipase family protein [Candidatus Zixiibacteriota bacterium]|nr:MAG: patatin-like phospholipase family protein [candidate division Zixibacteria bacterium]